MPFPWGALLGFGGSLVGGLSGMLGGGNSGWKNYKRRIQATVADAKAAGIHPLAALGASGLGGDYGSSPITWGDSIGAGMQAMGGAMDEYMAQDADRIEGARRYREESRRATIDRIREDVARREEKARSDRAERLNQRLVESQVMLNEAQSRSMLQRARAAAVGASAGGNASDPNGVWENPFVKGSAPASRLENEYGNLVSDPYGLMKVTGDWSRWVDHQTDRLVQRYRRHKAPARPPGLRWRVR